MKRYPIAEERNRIKNNEKRQRMNANLKALEARNRANAYVVPKDSPLAPQIADKTVKPARKPLYPTL